MLKKAIGLGLVFALLFLLCACIHNHTWKDATCTEPKTCSVCGATEGTALGHTWKDATCTEPKTCSICGATEGVALGHDASWEVVSVDNIKAIKFMKQKCSICGDELDSKEEAITTFVENRVFTFNVEEFLARLQNTWNAQNKDIVELTFQYCVDSDGMSSFDIYNKNGAWFGFGWFYDGNDNAIEATAKDVPICSMRIFIGPIEGMEIDAVYWLFSELVGPCISAVDPSIPNGELYENAVLKNTYGIRDGKPLNGIFYSCLYFEEEAYFEFDIDISAR